MDVTIKDALTIIKKGGVGQSILSANEKDSVSSASSTMAKSGKTSLAVIEKDTQKFLGFVDTLDIAFHIVNNMMENSNAHPDEVDWSKSELVFKKKEFGHEEVGKILGMSRPASSPPRTFTLADSLRAVMDEMGNGQPRIAVLDGSKIVEVLSQSDVLSYIFWNMNGLSHKIQRADVDTIFECVKAKRISFTVPTSATAAQAVYVMKYHRVHCVGIVNKRGELVANFSASDVRGLTEHNLKHLAKPVMEYLLLRSQAFSEDEAAVKSVRPVVSCSSETSFESLVEKFFYYRLHRIWIVDGKHKPVTPISLTDVIRFMHFVTGMGKSFF